MASTEKVYGTLRRRGPRHRPRSRGGAVVALLVLGPLVARAQVPVLTYQYDNARSGANTHELSLTPATVDAAHFGPLFSHAVDGYVYAQPLYVPGVSIPGRGVHDVVYVATEHDSVYAFDAGSAEPPDDQPLWQTSFLFGAAVSTAPSADFGCSLLVPEIGITGTPVIDGASGTLYVVALTKEGGAYVQRLHALDIATGAEKPGSPVTITASVPGTGDGSTNGVVAFDPQRELQRAGLLLAGGGVYAAWASHCDFGPYHGWIIGYDAATLGRTSVFNTTPNGGLGGVWQSGAAPAADAEGNVYVATGNGTFDADGGGADYGNSVLKLSAGVTVRDYFTPFDQAQLSSADRDLGSSAVVLLPDQPGAHPHLLVTCGKAGKLYVVDRDQMGHFRAGGDEQIVQSIAQAVGGGAYGAPAYWKGEVYYVGAGDVPKAFRLADGRLSATPVSTAATIFGFPGATPVISANGSADGILWAVQMGTDHQAVLHAYDASDLSRELYDSSAAGRQDFGQAVKFVPPLVVAGRVYVAGVQRLTVFGQLLPSAAASPTPSPAAGARSAGGGCAVGARRQPSGVPLLALVVGLLWRRAVRRSP